MPPSLMERNLVLSLFPGLGLLDIAFEELGYCVVRGPDVIWGGDIRNFHPPADIFRGIIGGPPCQAFSRLRHLGEYRGYKPRFGNLIPEFERVVDEAQPVWYLAENVVGAPIATVSGYVAESLLLNNRVVGGIQRRKRRFVFGTHDGAKLDVSDSIVLFEQPEIAGTVTRARMSGRPVAEALRLQGLPTNWLEDCPLTKTGKQQAIANGVPLPMGRAIAKAVQQYDRMRAPEGETNNGCMGNT